MSAEVFAPQDLLVILLIIMVTGYTSGWRRLRHQARRDRRGGWQMALYLTGLLVLGLALLSPLEQWADELFTWHMVQHLLLIMVAPPLLLCANPLPVYLWALPRRARHQLGRLLRPGAVVRSGVRAVTWPPVAWPVFVGTLWAWHSSTLYQAALRHEALHALEHVAFFGTALLFWWPIITPAPQVRGRLHPGLQIVYLMAATGQNTLLAATIALAKRVRYPVYATAPHLWGLSALNDQALGGGLMWVAGHMYLLPILLVVARALGEEERRTRQRQATRPTA
jgi:cytochrome c oxidase assembly factor CtaG